MPAKKKQKERDLMGELIVLLRQIAKAPVASMEHRVESGGHFEKRYFDTSSIGPKENSHVKIVVHRWWGDRR